MGGVCRPDGASWRQAVRQYCTHFTDVETEAQRGRLAWNPTGVSACSLAYDNPQTAGTETSQEEVPKGRQRPSDQTRLCQPLLPCLKAAASSQRPWSSAPGRWPLWGQKPIRQPREGHALASATLKPIAQSVGTAQKVRNVPAALPGTAEGDIHGHGSGSLNPQGGLLEQGFSRVFSAWVLGAGRPPRVMQGEDSGPRPAPLHHSWQPPTGPGYVEQKSAASGSGPRAAALA